MELKEIARKPGFKWGVLTAIFSLAGIFIAGALHSGRDGMVIAREIVHLVIACTVGYGIWHYARRREPGRTPAVRPIIINGAEPAHVRQLRAQLAELQHELKGAARERQQLLLHCQALERAAQEEQARVNGLEAELERRQEIAASREQERDMALQQRELWRARAEESMRRIEAQPVMKWQQVLELLAWARRIERLTVRKTRDRLRAGGVPIPEGEMSLFSHSVRALPPLPHPEKVPAIPALPPVGGPPPAGRTAGRRADGRTDRRRTAGRATRRTRPRNGRREAP